METASLFKVGLFWPGPSASRPIEQILKILIEERVADRHRTKPIENTYLIIVSYSLSLHLLTWYFLYIIEASTFAGENVFGSFNIEMTLNRIVLENKNYIESSS